MDKLSNLLKEARPLYKKRQRRKAVAKIVFTLCAPVFLSVAAYQICLEGDNIYMALSQDDFQVQFLDDEFGLLRVK